MISSTAGAPSMVILVFPFSLVNVAISTVDYNLYIKSKTSIE
jgi:hypothetical protein